MGDIAMVRGETATVQVTVSDVDGVPVDLTGYTVKWHASNGLERSTTDGTITVAGAVFSFTLAADDTEVTPDRPASYPHEAKVKSPGGVVKQVLTGSLVLAATQITDI